MRNLKKVLALVLAMAMSLSLAVTAGAAFNDQDKIVNTEAVDMCSALGIINGYTDGSFKPEGNVTRAEAAKMITIALNGGKEPTLSASATPTYSDIAGHWAAKYIEYCTSLGIVAGDGAGKFNPNGNVKAVELAKMLLIAIGYSADAEKFVGANWDTNVNVVASQKDLYEELESIDPSVAATRDTAAQMVWNALNIFMVEYDYKLTTVNGTLTSELVVKDTKDTLLTKKFATIATKYTTGTLVDVQYNDTDAEYTYTIDCGVEKCEDCITKFTTEANYVELLGQNVTFVAKAADKVYGAFSNGVVVASALVGDYDFEDLADEIVAIDGTEYDAETALTYYVAATEYTGDYGAYVTEVEEFNFAPYFTANAIDANDDGTVDTIVVIGATITNVTYVGKDYVKVADKVVDEDKLMTEDYAVYEGVAKDDKVLVSADLTLVSKGTISEIEKQTGKVESRSGDNVVIDGTTYDYSQLNKDDKAELTSNMNKDVEFYAYNGYLLTVDAATSVDISEYAVVTKIVGEAGMTGPQAKLLFTDGTEQVVDLAADYANGVADDPKTEDVNEAVAKIAVGTMVQFDIEDGEYELTVVESLDAEAFDAITLAEKAWEGAKSASDADAKVNFTVKEKTQAAKFAADAIVFVFDGEDYTVQTGADLAKVTDSDATVKFAGAEKNSTNALTVTFGYILTAGISDSDTLYGYVVSENVSYSADADGAYETITIWNGEKEVDLTTAADESFDIEVAQGMVVEYKVDADGAVSYIKNIGQKGALTVIDGDYVTIGTEIEIDEDTVILYVDSELYAGEEGGSINVANEDENEKPVDNVWYLADKGVMLVLVVDVNNEWYVEAAE